MQRLVVAVRVVMWTALLVVVGMGGLVSAQPPLSLPVDPMPLRLSDLGWLAGDWTGRGADGSMEAHYSALAGGSMLGTSRVVSENRSLHVEFVLFEETHDGVFLTNIQPGRREIRFKLVRFDPVNGSVFETQRGPVERLIYRREADGGLSIRLEKTVSAVMGPPWSITFRLKRATAR